MNYKPEGGKGNEATTWKLVYRAENAVWVIFLDYGNEEHLWEFANSLQHKSFCFRLYL